MPLSTPMPDPAVPPLRVVVVDDEELARWRIRSLVTQCPAPVAEVVAELADAEQTLAWLARNRCDVLLLDIQMPGLLGTALAAELQGKPDAPALVFVTAHAEHAVKAFELQALDYLTKPVQRERLQAALQRVAQRRADLVLRNTGTPETVPDEAVIPVNDRGRLLRVPISEVIYLKAELKYVTLRTAAHSHVLDESLAELEPRLGERFLRIHRNAIVARRAVRALERRIVVGGDEGGGSSETWAVRLEPVGEWLAVSRRQLPAVREALTQV